MKTILYGWNFMRALRLILGVAVIVQGVVAKDTVSIVLGVLVGGMALANIGCCGTSGCAINPRTDNQTQTIEYEELDNKK
jgi:Kef-type K+ transport system membrane component KefB